MQTTTDLEIVTNERLIYEAKKRQNSWSPNYNIKEEPKKTKEEIKIKTT